MLITAENITKSFLDDTILCGVSLKVNESDRTGLLGVNGAGKTTLFNILAGTLPPDGGVVRRRRGLRVGYLRQSDMLCRHYTLADEIKDAFAPVYALSDGMKACAAELEQAPGAPDLLARYDSLQARFEALGGYRMDDSASRVLNGLGFGGFNRQTPVETLSGGEKMRFAFAKLLLTAPELLLLDEPTNHLDFSMLAWLEEYLAGYRGAVVVVSHDRYFLDAVAKDICELERGRLTSYRGNYSSFTAQKAERVKTQQRAYEKQQSEIARMENYVQRNLVRASTTGMAQSRRRALEKMERVEPPSSMEKDIRLCFGYDVEPFERVLCCEALSIQVGKKQTARLLCRELDLEILRGEKIALVGPNGVGKTTFLKAVQNILPHSGVVRWGGNVRLGYFDQELAGLPMEAGVLEAVHSRYPAKTEYELRTLLGQLRITGDAVHKRVRELSGAMRAKVAFAILVLRRANVLLLDEPTNHLDYMAKEVLEEALEAFTGTLLAVSHDRYFLRRVPTAILEMHPQGFVRYNGNYDTYMQNRATASHAAPKPANAAEKPAGQAAGGKRTKQQRALDAQHREHVARLEKQIVKLEALAAELNAQLASGENAGNYEKLAGLSERLQRCNAELDEAGEAWLALTIE